MKFIPLLVLLTLGAVSAEVVYRPLSPVNYALDEDRVLIMTYEGPEAKLDLVSLSNRTALRLNPPVPIGTYFFEYALERGSQRAVVISYGGTASYPLRRYDLATSTWSVLDDNTDYKQSPALSGSVTTWVDLRNPLPTSSATLVSSSSRLGGGGFGGTSSGGSQGGTFTGGASPAEVYLRLRESDASQRVTQDTNHQEKLTTNGTHLAWVEYTGTMKGNIVLRDLSNGTQRVVDGGVFHQDFPHLCADWLVWEDYRRDPAAGDIYAMRLAGGTSTLVSAQSAHQGKPFCHGNTVVWEDYRGTTGLGRIFGKDLSANLPELEMVTSINHLALPKLSAGYLTWYEMTLSEILLHATLRQDSGVGLARSPSHIPRWTLQYSSAGVVVKSTSLQQGHSPSGQWIRPDGVSTPAHFSQQGTNWTTPYPQNHTPHWVLVMESK